jgi:hypothetical protein
MATETIKVFLILSFPIHLNTRPTNVGHEKPTASAGYGSASISGLARLSSANPKAPARVPHSCLCRFFALYSLP